MNLFFDMDYTLIGADGSLRPLVREVFQRLKEEGHDIYIWSGVGLRQYEVRTLKLEAWVSGVFLKPLYNYEAMMERMGIPVKPDLVIDDYPEIVSAFGGILIKPYILADEADREMERVYRIIQDYARDGQVQDPAFLPKQG